MQNLGLLVKCYLRGPECHVQLSVIRPASLRLRSPREELFHVTLPPEVIYLLEVDRGDDALYWQIPNLDNSFYKMGSNEKPL